MNNIQKIRHDWFDHELNETRWTGYNVSGLESGSHKVLGTIGVNYIDVHNADYSKKLYEMGVNVVRLPFMLERLIPNYHPNNVYPNGFEFINKQYSSIIKQFVCECEKYGIDVILDIHNYGQFYFQKHGGYTSNLISNYGSGNFSVLDNRYEINASNELQIRTPGNLSRVDPFEYVLGGSGLPYVGNKFIYKAEIKINVGNGNPWNQGKVVVNFLDAQNFYEVSIGANTAIVELAKNINGVRTVLASAPFTYIANSSVTVAIDFNNTTPGSIVANINAGAVTLTGSIDNDLLYGRAGYFAAEAQMNVVTYQLTCFDSSNVAESNLLQNNSAEIAWGKTVGSTTHSTAVHQFFYEQIFKEFDHLEGIIAYDYNEPHDLEEQTTTANYLTTATATVFQQVALNKIRELGSKKWFGWTSDDWSGAQNITQKYTNGIDPNGRWGANFDLPFKDPLQRTFLTFHFYADKYATPTFNNSGTFGAIDGQTPIPYTKAEIDDQLDKLILRWKKINIARKATNEYPIPLYIGESGSPESSQWNETLDYILEKLTKAGAGYSYFGIGRFLGNNPNNIAADFSEITQINGKDVVALTKIQDRHKVVDKYLNKESFVKNSSKKSCKKDKEIVLFKTHCKKKKLPNKFVANWASAVKIDELLFTSSSSDNSNPTPTGMVNGWNTELVLSYNSAVGGWNDLYNDAKYRVIAWNNAGGPWNANSKPHNNWITNVNGGVPVAYNDGFFAANLSKSGSINDKKILFKSFNLIAGKYYRFRMEAINALQTQFSGDNPNLRLTVNGATIANTGGITVSQEYSVEFMAATSGVQELSLYSNVIADGGNDILINYIIVEEADVVEVEVETCEKFNEYREVTDEAISSVVLFYTDEENNKIAFDPNSIALEESCCYEETPIIPPTKFRIGNNENEVLQTVNLDVDFRAENTNGAVNNLFIDSINNQLIRIQEEVPNYNIYQNFETNPAKEGTNVKYTLLKGVDRVDLLAIPSYIDLLLNDQNNKDRSTQVTFVNYAPSDVVLNCESNDSILYDTNKSIVLKQYDSITVQHTVTPAETTSNLMWEVVSWYSKARLESYTELVNLTANTPYPITHNLGYEFVQTETRYEKAGAANDGSIINLRVINRAINTLELISSVDQDNVRVIIK